MEGYAHRVSAAALRSRGLVKISGRGPTWRATITDAGRRLLTPVASDDSDTCSQERPLGGASTPGHVGGAQASPSDQPQLTAPPQGPRAATPVIAVPAQLRAAHPFVLATRNAAIGVAPVNEGRIRIGPQAGVVYMVLSRGLLRRALLVVQGLIREAVKRGWQVVPHTRTGYDDHLGVAIEIRGHRYPIEVH
jgi:hypothetical protein